ncbi:TonB-dependent siderophore receptor [Nostoc favosum]|uniref:TonB-dependent siderophore receptor n=1 Tax=Nostoc favosum CHAB5714 TaxID=2780399 RepID=A0ABS8IM79_9NOSO|nr:TonB-dependent siderophore receptor [Nostoc favosum]MCC5604890.1 TonB-dependent siderophore receptor [Nostoc favosum CHAB5714]
MKHWQLFVGVSLSLVASLSGFLGIVAIQPGLAEEKLSNEEHKSNSTELNAIALQEVSKNIPQLSEIELPATNAQMLVQTPTPTNPPSTQADVVAITGVKANATEKGVEVILETSLGDKLQVANRSTGNNFIADITGGQLRLPNADAFTFKSEKPIEGITSITVTNVDANTVRVTVVGEKALPAVELFDGDEGLIFAVSSTATSAQTPETPTEEQPATEKPEEQPATQQDEPIELVVTGEQDGYNVPNASTATRTDTPLRDIPQSIQVVPRQVLEDRGIRDELEAIETVSGVLDSDTRGIEAGISNIAIRGFSSSFSSSIRLRDGLPSEFRQSFIPIGAIEQVEVLKGPASVLFGALEPGGVVNFVTRRPLAEPYYRIGFEAGNYGLYQPSIDFSGPLTEDGSVLYRLIAAYQGGGDFKDSTPLQDQKISITPSMTFRFGDRTNLNLYYEYGKFRTDSDVEPLLSDGSLIPSNFYPYYFSLADLETHRVGYTLNHQFNDSWQLRHSLSTTFGTFQNQAIYYTSVLEDRFVSDFFAYDSVSTVDKYTGLVDLVGKFNTGSISHQLVAGFDFNREVSYFWFDDSLGALDLPPLDILNPNYDVPLPEIPPARLTNFGVSQSYGVYLQDQIAFTDNLKMLIGGRYDWISSDTGLIDGDRAIQTNGAFSPRIGLVYQPSKNVSLYTSYSQSFRPSIGRNPDNDPFEPTRGTQYEVGVKADFLDGRLSATLAAYNLTRTNVLTTDPDPELARQGFQVQVGEQRSRGIELDVTGEILPGWNIIAAYALTEAEVIEDNSIPSAVGNRLTGIPQHQASLWTAYTIQEGDLQGVGFGLGLFYVGERQGDLENSFRVGDYLRTDAALYYRRNGFNAAINVRNLFNIDYVSSVNFGTLYINRGNPLTIVGSVSWEF